MSVLLQFAVYEPWQVQIESGPTPPHQPQPRWTVAKRCWLVSLRDMGHAPPGMGGLWSGLAVEHAAGAPDALTSARTRS